MAYTFVDSDLHDARKLLSLLGSFWSDLYLGVDQVLRHCVGVGEAGYQASIDLVETIASVGRPTVPVFHTEQWYACTLFESARGIAPVLYGEPQAGVFGGGLSYGSSVAPVYAWPCPVANVDLISNRIYDPSATLVRGVDYVIDSGRLVFLADPFADPRLLPAPVLDATGRLIDRQLTLWLFRPAVDQEHIWVQFGYIMGIRLPSSQGYKDLVNGLLDAIVACTATDQVDAVLAAVTGCPLAGGAEVVEATPVFAGEQLVITDARAYRYPTAAVPVVQVGDAVIDGDALVDTVESHYLNHGTVPDWLDSFSVGEGLLAPGYLSDLTFGGTDTPLVVEEDVDGYTKVSWALGGFPADVAEFWAEVHRRGVASGTTLAHLLDLRDLPAGEPTAADLPATINPLTFLASNYLRHNALLVRIKTGGFGPAALGLGQLRHLRRIVPPHEAVLIMLEMPAVADSVIVDGVDGLVDEMLLSYSAGELPYEWGADPSYVGDGPSTAAVVLGTCYGEADG
jgi:hypothetical protein